MQFSLNRVRAKRTLVMAFLLLSVTAITYFFNTTAALAQIVTVNPDGSVNISTPVGSETITIPPRPIIPGLNDDSNFIPGVNTGTIPIDQAALNALGGGASGGPGGTLGSGADTTTVTQEQPTVVIEPGNTINQKLHSFVVTYVGWLMSHAGSFFDYTIREFIIGFGNNYKTKNTGFAVESVWVVVRDVFNLTFIFGIIYIGFRLILSSDDSRAKSTLVSLLAAALLVNFSLFITKFIVDVANITATEIYSAVPASIQSGVGVGGEITGFGQLYIQQVGLASALGIGVSDTTNSFNVRTIDFSKSEQSLGYIFGLMMLFLIAAFVFLAGAVMVTIRFFVLLIYMIFSPIMFLGWVFPNFAGTTTKWWSGFLGKAFFAPAYVFMLYISLLIITKYAEGMPERGHNLANIFISPTIERAGEAFAFFGIATVSMLASLVVAQKMGADGATTAIAWGKGTANFGKRTLQGAAGGITRVTLDRTGGLGRAISTYTPLRDISDKAVKNSVWSSADRKRRSSEIATRSADAKVQKEIAEHAKKAHSNPASEVALATVVRRSSPAQLMTSLRKAKAGTQAHANIVSAMTHDKRKKIMDAKDDEFKPHEKTNVANVAVSNITNKIKTPVGSAHKLDPVAVSKLTPQEIDTLGNKWMTDPNNLALLTKSQVDGVADKTTELSETQKSGYVESWKKAILAQTRTPVFIESIMKDRTAKDVAALPAEILTNVAAIPHLSEKVLREIATSNLLSRDRDDIVINMGNPGANSSGEDYLSRPKNNHRDTHW